MSVSVVTELVLKKKIKSCEKVGITVTLSSCGYSAVVNHLSRRALVQHGLRDALLQQHPLGAARGARPLMRSGHRVDLDHFDLDIGLSFENLFAVILRKSFLME